MKIKKGFILRKLGKEYMVVAIGDASRHFNGMIRMNEAGAWLWDQLKDEISQETLVERMCAYYEDLARETAQADLEEFLNSIDLALDR